MFLVGCAVPRTIGGADPSSNIGAGDCSGTAFAQDGACVTIELEVHTSNGLDYNVRA
jgi:hypothetical protein